MINSEITDAGGTTVEADYNYDPLGRLYEVAVVGGDARRYLWDGGSIIAEYDTSGNVTERYAYRPGSLGAPAVIFDGAGTALGDRHIVQTDERGSVLSIADANGGTMESINSYGPYGEPSDSNVGAFGYTGQLWLPEAGLWYMRNRVYDPALGQFMQTDPIGYEGGMNLYAYVGGDPVNAWDPLGLRLVTCPDGVTPGCLAVEGQRIDPCSIGWSCTSIDQLENPRGPTSFFSGEGGAGGGGREGADTPESEEAYEDDNATCRSLSNAAARSRCFQSATARDSARRWGRPLPPLIQWRTAIPRPQSPNP